jgi:transketolase N-terminal domain/subunit
MTTKKLLDYSIKNNLKHIPSTLSQFSYLKYVLPIIKKDFNIVIGKPFGSQAYYTIWEELGYIKEDQELSYGVKHEELDFVNFSEETLGNALGVASGIATVSDKVTYCNISDGALQMGPTLEAIQYIGKNKQNIVLTVDFNGMQLTDSIQNTIGINSFNIEAMFKMYGWNVHFHDTRVLNSIGMNMVIKQAIKFQEDTNKPTVIIFKTSKGQGVKEMEDDPVKWHYKSLDNIKEVTINEN